MAEINWTEEAEQWLKDIHDYIAQDKPEAAIREVWGRSLVLQYLSNPFRAGS